MRVLLGGIQVTGILVSIGCGWRANEEKRSEFHSDFIEMCVRLELTVCPALLA